jgi:excisionase family DNA binding protein
MSTAQAAQILGKSTWWVQRQCAKGAIKSSFYGGSYNISEETVTAFIEANLVAAKPSASRRRPRRL